MNADALRAQVRELLQSRAPATQTAGVGVLMPLRLGSSVDAPMLANLFRRVAASPALAQAAAAGLLRFDLRLDLTGDTESTNCCGGCAAQAAPPVAPSAVPELKGVITERGVKSLDKTVQQVRLGPGAVLTPLGREALRQRSIRVVRGEAS